MQANKIHRRQLSSLLNEHWKRKQRLKCNRQVLRSSASANLNGADSHSLEASETKSDLDDALGPTSFCCPTCRRKLAEDQRPSDGRSTSQDMCNSLGGSQIICANLEEDNSPEPVFCPNREPWLGGRRRNHSNEIIGAKTARLQQLQLAETSDNQRRSGHTSSFPTAIGPLETSANQTTTTCQQLSNEHNHSDNRSLWRRFETRRRHSHMLLFLLMLSLTAASELAHKMRPTTSSAGGPQLVQASASIHSDPRPTIYSGQVSFGLLLSAHSSMGTELSTAAASQQVAFASKLPATLAMTTAPPSRSSTTITTTSTLEQTLMPAIGNVSSNTLTSGMNQTIGAIGAGDMLLADDSAPIGAFLGATRPGEQTAAEESQFAPYISQRRGPAKRQIFSSPKSAQSQASSQNNNKQTVQSKSQSSGAPTDLQVMQTSTCGQVNSNALYAGMSAIWASHQANLVGDSHLNIGTYVYDSCNDLDVGQRQAVRIVSNVNAFQQTTCESPRGSPISLTIAHGENQLRAIQLLTSFRVPVITTKEHFALEDYNQLSRDQRRFLFTTAPSSRHLAVGALRFSKRIVSRSTSSPKLLNQFYKMSSRNGLIVISSNLPSKFVHYLKEIIPNHVNYEMLQSDQPIDQIRSVEALESVLVKNPSLSSQSTSTGVSESRMIKIISEPSMKMRNLTRRRRQASDDTDSTSDSSSSSGPAGGLGNDFDIPGEGENPKMLSPTILMFITQSEAIDLVTRLRNDLAEVSKYYSLIVSTREDISPVLKTIFHSGGSRLCSGKAFYTISPKPDDVSEFSRYFRDTVQMEGETSDHPLITEFAKYQSTTKLSRDLDDISTETIIKAVWAAAAAFKSVYKQQCPGMSLSKNGNHHHQRDSDSSGKPNDASMRSSSEQCMSKMNKVMPTLVQRSLKRLDVIINSTGLQALDGFRIKFDDQNELLTNRFSIKYINKECEITEIGQFSGYKDSTLRIDEDLLIKSVETTLPDPWPVASSSVGTPSSSSSSGGSSLSGNLQTQDGTSASPPGGDSNKLDSLSSTDEGSEVKLASDSSDTNGDSELARRRQKSTQDDGGSGLDLGREDDENNDSPDKTNNADTVTKKAANKRRSRPDNAARLTRRTKQPEPASKAKSSTGGSQQLTTIAEGTLGSTPGLSDTEGNEERPLVADLKAVKPLDSPPPFPATRSTSAPMRKLKPYQTTVTGASLRDWLPSSSQAPPLPSLMLTSRQPQPDREQIDYGGTQPPDLRTRGTTQAPVFTTLPESDGNADLELPAKITTKQDSTARTSGRPATTISPTSGSRPAQGDTFSAASSTESVSNYVTSASISQEFTAPKTGFSSSKSGQRPNARTGSALDDRSPPVDQSPSSLDPTRFSYLREINSSPVPLIPTTLRPASGSSAQRAWGQPDKTQQQPGARSKLRSQLKWIHGSWFALSILAANICGALFTLYVLSFLLLKNCDGSFDRESQGIRSMHLLAIIVAFFGSTLFIVYPTPGLCLLRNSWHNFALVLLFGSLLLQTMQTRSLSSLGLGGRPNRLNQFLTLVFMVGVQVSFELQKWKYESPSYLQFVNQYFGSSEAGDKKLNALSSSIASQFNPLNSFNDQVTPVSIQVSEKYQSLLQGYCSLQTEEFIQSQIYLFIIVSLLIIFSISTRKSRRLPGGNHHHHKLTTSGKMVASQHETNLTSDMSSGLFQFSSNVTNESSNARNLFVVALITGPTYIGSVLLHVYGHTNSTNHDLIFSLTMVCVAFTTLIGIFLPVLRQVHRYEDLMSGRITGTIGRPTMGGPNAQSSQTFQQQYNGDGGSLASQHRNSSTFAMFPEFAQTGLRRPSSVSGDSSSGAGSRRPFAETRESRKKMGVALANLGPSADSLRSLGFNGYDSDKSANGAIPAAIDPSLLNLKLNMGTKASHENEELTAELTDDLYHQKPANRRHSRNEKRLIMLDVDPCCPRHGFVAATTSSKAQQPVDGPPPSRASSNNGKPSKYHQNGHHPHHYQ